MAEDGGRWFDSVEGIAARDVFGPDHVTPAGRVIVLSRGQPFEAEAFADDEGTRYVPLPPEVGAVLALTPLPAAAADDAVLAKIVGAVAGEVGGAVARAIEALGARLDDGRAHDAMGTAGALNLLATALDRLAASQEALSKRTVAVHVTPAVQVNAVLSVPRTTKRLNYAAGLPDHIESITTTTEPEA